MTLSLRCAVRTLRQQRLGATLVSLVLALGTGIPGAMLAALVAVERPLESADARVFRLFGVTPESSLLNVSPPDFYDFRASTPATAVAAITPFAPELTLTGRGEPRIVVSRRLSAGFFHTLGVALLAGREFLVSEEQPPARPVILSQAFARDVLGSVSDAPGQLLTLNGSSYTVVGVAAPHQEVFGHADLWLPAQFPSPTLRGLRLLSVIARVADPSSFSLISSRLSAVARDLQQRYPDTHHRADVRLTPLDESVAGPLRQPIRMIASAAMVLWVLTACVAAGFALALALQSRHDAAVRHALGASEWRLWTAAVGPCVVLVGAALPFAFVVSRWTLAITESANLLALPRPASFGTATASCCGLAVAALAIMATMTRLVPMPERPDAMRGAGRVASRSQRIVVALEFACAVPLLTLAAALVSAVLSISGRDPGFTSVDRVFAHLTLPTAAAGPSAARWRAIAAASASLPGVRRVAFASELPHTGQDNPAPFTLGEPGGRRIVAGVRAISPSYPEVADLHLHAGRPLTDTDDERSARVALVNRRLAREVFGREDVVGRTIAVDVSQPPLTAAIVGVVADIRHSSLWSDVTPEVYFSSNQVPLPSLTLVLEMMVPPAALQPELRSVLHRLEPDMAVPPLARWSDAVESRVLPHKRRALFAAVLGVLALLLVAASLYALAMQTLEAQRHELAIRLALGCPPRAAAWRIVAVAGQMAAAGSLTGLIGALLVVRLAAGALTPLSVAAMWGAAFGSILLLGTTSAIAAWQPARDAARLDPSVALTR